MCLAVDTNRMRLEAIVLSDNVLRGNLYQTGFQNLVGEFRCQDNQPQVRYYALAAICSQDCGNPCTMVGGLRELRLDGNQLNGEIPEECARLYKTIKVMDISSNQLTGSIPVNSSFRLRMLAMRCPILTH